MNLAQGQRFGQWTLQELIDGGGNGVVWLAKNPEGTIATVKFLQCCHLGKQRETRFRDEIKFLNKEASRLGILPLIDFYLPKVSTEEDRPWYTTPFAKCFTKLELAGVAKFPELVCHIEIVARTLAKLNDDKKWHRDLKPENLFILDGIPVIGDFGLADFPEKEAKTGDSETLGSRNYTAPELEKDAADTPAGSADVYSLAKTLWVLACGRFPPQGTLRMDTPELRISKQCPHPQAGYFDGLLENCTKYDPADRPTMRYFAEELSAWLKLQSNENDRTDFGVLAKENESIFEIENKSERKRQERIQAAEVILRSFDPVLIKIAAELSAFAKKEIFVERGAYDLPGKFHFVELFQSVRLVSRCAKQVKVTVTANHRFVISLHSFVQVEALDNDAIRVVVGHLVQPRANGDFVIVWKPWTREAIRPLGSAQLENECKALGIEFLAQLESAVREFVDKVKGNVTYITGGASTEELSGDDLADMGRNEIQDERRRAKKEKEERFWREFKVFIKDVDQKLLFLRTCGISDAILQYRLPLDNAKDLLKEAKELELDCDLHARFRKMVDHIRIIDEFMDLGVEKLKQQVSNFNMHKDSLFLLVFEMSKQYS